MVLVSRRTLSEAIGLAASCGVWAGATSGVANWLGHSFTQVSFLHSVGYGAVLGISSVITLTILDKLNISNSHIRIGFTTLFGGAAAYVASAAAAALGIVAAPITVSGAVVLVVSTVALSVLGFHIFEFCERGYDGYRLHYCHPL